MPRAQMPTHLGGNYVDPRGFIGSYAPSDRYVSECTTYNCQSPSNPLAYCNNNVQAMGPCSAGYGLSSKQLFPAAISPCDGFDQVLVSAPLDILYADNLMNDVNVLTTTRGQTWDPRGEPTIAAVFSRDQTGRLEMGAFGGALESTRGVYSVRKPVRTYTI